MPGRQQLTCCVLALAAVVDPDAAEWFLAGLRQDECQNLAQTFLVAFLTSAPGSLQLGLCLFSAARQTLTGACNKEQCLVQQMTRTPVL